MLWSHSKYTVVIQYWQKQPQIVKRVKASHKFRGVFLARPGYSVNDRMINDHSIFWLPPPPPSCPSSIMYSPPRPLLFFFFFFYLPLSPCLRRVEELKETWRKEKEESSDASTSVLPMYVVLLPYHNNPNTKYYQYDQYWSFFLSVCPMNTLGPNKNGQEHKKNRCETR